MNVATHRLGRRYGSVAGRVEAIVDQAASLVQGAIPGRMIPTRIVVVEAQDVAVAVLGAEQDALGVRAKPMRATRPEIGHATLDSRGAVVVLNATGLARLKTRETDITVVHELVHVAQFSRPGAYAYLLEGLRNNYGLTKWTWRDARAANKQVAADEREARRHEHLARRLTVA